MVIARLDQILGNLDKDGVTEVMLESGRPVQVREDGVYVPVSQKPVPRDELEALFADTDITLPKAEGTQPAVDVMVGTRFVKVRTSKRGNSIIIRIERSKAQPPAATPTRAKTPTRAPTSRTTTRERAPAAARTATRSKRTTSAPRGKTQSDVTRPKRATNAPPAEPEFSLDIELGPPTARPERRAHSHSRIKISGGREKELDLEAAAFKMDSPRRPGLDIDVDAATQRPSLSLPHLPTQPLAKFREPSQPLPKQPSQKISVPASIPPPKQADAPLALRETAEVPQFELDLSLDDLVPSQAQPAPTVRPAPVKPAKIELEEPVETARPRPATRRPDVSPIKLQELVGQARARGATDLLLATNRPVLARIGGELVPLDKAAPPLAGVDEILLALLDVEQQSRLQKLGYVDLAVEIGGARLRANIGRYQGGLKGSFRIAALAPQTLQELGLPKELAKVVSHHQGLVVIAGPSGHGKTTTLAALVDLVNAHRAHHIITVEDPIEIVYERKAAVVSQREAGRHTKSFASALKASLREDPDVIVIGELRDRETVEIALTAAETGHLVLATMSTPSAAKTIDRLIDMFPAEEQQQVRISVASALRAIVAQKLLPAVGGGVVPAIELVTGVLPLAVLIRDDKLFQLPSLMQRGKAFGMIKLEDSMAELQRAGKIK